MILNFILFQAALFACVAGAAASKPLLGVAVTFFVALAFIPSKTIKNRTEIDIVSLFHRYGI